jgi:hypothetical protein
MLHLFLIHYNTYFKYILHIFKIYIDIFLIHIYTLMFVGQVLSQLKTQVKHKKTTTLIGFPN